MSKDKTTPTTDPGASPPTNLPARTKKPAPVADGVQVLASREYGDGTTVRVLQDAKRVWKETVPTKGAGDA